MKKCKVEDQRKVGRGFEKESRTTQGVTKVNDNPKPAEVRGCRYLQRLKGR